VAATARTLSADPSWPKNCYIEELIPSMPYLTFDTEPTEDGTSLLDGREGKSLACISDPNPDYGGDIRTSPTRFRFDRTTSAYESWLSDLRITFAAYEYEETSLESCRVAFDEYVPQGGLHLLTQANAYCNGVTVDFWTPLPWVSAEKLLGSVLRSIT
jgi:hypothetical protein